MAARNPKFDAYIKAAAPFAQPILREIREVVHEACPDAVEVIKWGAPMFEYGGRLMVRMAAFKGHVSLGFWNASLVVGDRPGAEEAGGQFGRLASLKDLPARRTLAGYVKKAAALNESGVAPLRPRKGPKPPLPTPDAFSLALKQHRLAAKEWAGFPAGKQREYNEWILEAKTDATRDKRIAQALGWIAEGKGRNWKYQK